VKRPFLTAITSCYVGAMIEIRPSTRYDRSSVFALLEGLDDRYAGAMGWLERRLDDISRRRATLWEARRDGVQIGIAIVADKGLRSRKLCTFKVAAPFRRQRVGRQLLTAIKSQWLREEIETAYVTVDRSDPVTQHFFLAEGFVGRTDAPRRYAADRYDDLFFWRAEATNRSAAVG